MPRNYQLKWEPTYYATTFAADESPLSEGGAWVTGLPDHTSVVTSGGSAFGTMDNHANGPFNDSAAFRAGTWSGNHYIQGVVRKLAPATYEEIELLLCCKLINGSSQFRCYEITIAFDGSYSGIVRWDGGPMTDFDNGFTLILTGPGGYTVNDGDTIRAELVGSVITVKINGTTLFTHDLSTGLGSGTVFSDGAPGIGFYRSQSSANNSQFGWASVVLGSL